MSDVRTRICVFVMVVGVALVIGGIDIGSSKITAETPLPETTTLHCSSVFSGPSHNTEMTLHLNGLRFDVHDDALRYAAQCNDARSRRGLFTWALIVIGALMIAGGVLVYWPAKSEGKQWEWE